MIRRGKCHSRNLGSGCNKALNLKRIIIRPGGKNTFTVKIDIIQRNKIENITRIGKTEVQTREHVNQNAIKVIAYTYNYDFEYLINSNRIY